MNIPTSIALALALSCASGISEGRLEQVATGFDRPVWAGMPKNSQGKLWVMEQAGTVWILDLKQGTRLQEPFLSIESRVTRQGNEQGLLGLAFDPNFETSGRYYVYYTDNKDRTCVARYQSTDGRTTSAESEEILLRYHQPYRNHNGGWLDFGPDGMLYIGSGDGGAANDPKQHGQALDSLLAKILRIDVSPQVGYRIPADNPFIDTDQARPEIWAYGIRNPWRGSFDRKTGDLWIGDVGQNHWEEINFMPYGKGAGANYGWRLREGLVQTPKPKVGGDAPTGHVAPIYVYKHGSGPNEGLSVTGGYVYRGSVKELQGRYIFADYQLPRIWSFAVKHGQAVDFKNHSNEWNAKDSPISLISSFAEDNDGELYVISLAGSIHRIAAD